jgi:putative (di)nucleoside polyphosphate hydrolase
MRPCVGIALFNAQGRVWMGRRQPKWTRWHPDYVDGPVWQGGINREEPARDAVFRELFEETGITSADVIAEIPAWLSFELPRDLVGVALKGKFSGQRLRWFAMRFCGEDDEISLNPQGRRKPEFDAWRWADLDELPALVVPFKRSAYQTVVEEFAPIARRAAQVPAAR